MNHGVVIQRYVTTVTFSKIIRITVEASSIWQTLCINDVIADDIINTQGLPCASKIIADIGLMS